MSHKIPDFLDTILKKIHSGKLISDYSHSTSITENQFDTDCSGLLAFVLKKTGNKNALLEILEYKRQTQKTAQDFNKAFTINYINSITSNKKLKYWKSIENINNLMDGDLIFLKNKILKSNTNHTAFIRKVKQISNNKYELKITDSANSYVPMFNDTRTSPGIGMCNIYLTKTDEPNIFLIDYSENFQMIEKEVFFARLVK